MRDAPEADQAPPDEAALLRRGLPAPLRPDPSPERVMFVACGALAPDLLALKTANGWDHVDLDCLPAILHSAPERIPEALRLRLRAARARGYGRVVAVFGDCGTGGRLDVVCAEEGVERLPGPDCQAVFAGRDAFAAAVAAEPDAFHLTDFLARHFDAIFWRGMGLDRHPELREMLFGHFTVLVHLAQTDDAATDAAAREAARKLGLRFSRRFTGRAALEADLAGFVARPGAR
ncbi:MAG: DUF1638 domain-containing protein [Rubrimonas sp.]|uniref:DUF1638 domain-containing protein n=1 Tax=Rubrimonas sp. TaxID=2036015 RepID=UPI003DD2654F